MSGPLKNLALCALLALVAMAASPVFANPPGGRGYHGGGPHGGPRGGPPPRGVPRWHGPSWGPRAYYPPSRTVVWGGANYYWGGGGWYRPWGPNFVVTAPPIGVVVPVLPSAYVVRPIGGLTYYVANDVYYTANPGGGYIVTSPPAGETYASQGAVASGDRTFVYPRGNQSADQQDRDRFDCHEWAMGQTGFDPTQPQSGGTREVAGQRSDYNRAFGACMEGRGYTVK